MSHRIALALIITSGDESQASALVTHRRKWLSIPDVEYGRVVLDTWCR